MCQTDQKKRDKLLQQERREKKTNKHMEQKAQKAQRLEEVSKRSGILSLLRLSCRSIL